MRIDNRNVIAGLILLAWGLTAYTLYSAEPVDIEKAKREQRQAEQEVKEAQNQLSANEKLVNESLSALRKIEADMVASQAEIETVEGQLAVINENISRLEGNIATEEAELKHLREEYLKAVKKMRVARKQGSNLAFLFSSKTFNEARRRMRYMREFSEWKDRKSGEIKDVVDLLELQRGQLVQARNDASVALSREKAAKEKLKRQQQEQQVEVSNLKANSDALRAKLKKRQADVRNLGNQISQLIAEQQAKEAREREARRKAEEEKRKAEERAAAERKAAEEAARKETASKESTKKETTKKESGKKETAKKETAASSEYAEARKRQPRSQSSASSSSSTPAESGFGGMKGKLPKPVNGTFTVISSFGIHPISPELPDIMDENLGIDVHVATGATVNAVYDGEVIKIYDRTNTPGFRNIVVVKHGDYITVYANLEQLSVKTGQKVSQGQALGTVGTDFDDTKNGLLHFEVWKNQTRLDPATWIKI